MSTAQKLERVVIGRRVESDYPAEMLDASDAAFEAYAHVDSWQCECSDCLAQKQDHVAALSSSYLLRFAELEAANEQRSRMPTIRCPRLSTSSEVE